MTGTPGTKTGTPGARPGPLVRPRASADLDACVSALAEVHRADAYPLRWPADPADWLTPPDLLHAWVADRGGAVVGHILLRTYDDAEMAPGIVEAAGLPVERLASVSRLFVVPRARRFGIAGALLRQADQAAAAEGRRLALDVVDDGRGGAIAFYEAAGWQRVTSGRAAWTAPDGAHPIVHFYLSPARG